MKPTRMFEKPTSLTEAVQTEARRKPTLSRKIVYMLVGVVAFVLIVSTVLLSVHFGIKMAKDNFKEYQATIVAKDGAILYEQVLVTDTEEVFSYDEAIAIVDFSTDLLTIKMMKSDFPENGCYVANLNNSHFDTPMEFKRKHPTSQITFETTTTKTYDITDVWLNTKALGSRSAELCRGKTVYFLLEKTDLTTREKRGSGRQCDIQIEIICIEFMNRLAAQILPALLQSSKTN